MSSDRRRRALVLDGNDSVANALESLDCGDRIEANGREVIVKEPVPMGHKVAIGFIRAGEPVLKFGEPIGVARRDIEPGCHVHTHNVESLFADWLVARTGACAS